MSQKNKMNAFEYNVIGLNSSSRFLEQMDDDSIRVS
jgi:hypothetical protein